MRYRIRYQKNDELVFISHLDLQRLFQRAFRRANIDLAYSEGFHPHPKMSYSPPLPLFVSSAEEYLDVELREIAEPDSIRLKLQEALPKSMAIGAVEDLGSQDQKLTKSIEAAEYVIDFTIDEDIVLCEPLLNWYQSKDPLHFQKRNKKKQLVKKDLRPGIRDLHCEQQSCSLSIRCTLDLSENEMINPFHMMAALSDTIPEMKSAKVCNVRKIRMIKKQMIS